MRRALKWIGITLGSIVVLLLVVVGGLYALSGSKLSAKHQVAPESELTIASDSATIARGEQLVAAIGCAECHGEGLAGKIVADAGPFALLSAPNLTRGRGGRTPPLSDVELERAIRHGVRRDSTSLIIMPSEVYNNLADEHTAPMIAYIKQLPAINREVPPTTLRIVGRILLGLGQFKLAADTTAKTPHVATVDTTPGPALGKYLVSVTGCYGCHGASLSGGPGFSPSDPPVANITPTGIGHYTESDFFRAMREGQRPSGAVIDTTMPWRSFGKLSDGELRSIYQFLKTVPPKQFQEK